MHFIIITTKGTYAYDADSFSDALRDAENSLSSWEKLIGIIIDQYDD